MPTKSELAKYYRNTEYLTFVKDVAIALRIGKSSRAMDRLLLGHGAKTAVFITAWNPRSEVASPSKNRKWNKSLFRDLQSIGKVAIFGQGRSLDHRFFEDSFLAIDLTKQEGLKFAKKYSQNAFVFYRLKSKAQLIWAKL
jgi:hypothetical protein